LSNDSEIELAASVAPEDLRCGDSVAILSLVHEYPSFFWCCDSTISSRHEPVRVSYTWPDGGIPLKIKAICLPFVFVKDPSGQHRHLDTRLYRLVRLTPGYAQKVRMALYRQRKKAPGPGGIPD
jgi:hypothetical protein